MQPLRLYFLRYCSSSGTDFCLQKGSFPSFLFPCSPLHTLKICSRVLGKEHFFAGYLMIFKYAYTRQQLPTLLFFLLFTHGIFNVIQKITVIWTWEIIYSCSNILCTSECFQTTGRGLKLLLPVKKCLASYHLRAF